MNSEICNLKPETNRLFSEPSMFLSTRSASISARIMLAGAWGVFCTMILAAPILLSSSCTRAASVLYLSFSTICHQIPERSFFILGYSFPVCERCSGIYLGLLLGSLVEARFVHRSSTARRVWVLAACIPMLSDFLLSFSGIWIGTGPGRFLTGLWFGCLISALLVRGVAELLIHPPWRHLAAGYSLFKKGYS